MIKARLRPVSLKTCDFCIQVRVERIKKKRSDSVLVLHSLMSDKKLSGEATLQIGGTHCLAVS